MDIRADLNPAFHHDGGQLPWQISDGAYDLFVSLQTFEHLGATAEGQSLAGQYGEVQVRAFAEVRRIARAAVISLPWQWHTPGDVRHHAIGWKTLEDWFGGGPPLLQFCERRVLLGFPAA